MAAKKRKGDMMNDAGNSKNQKMSSSYSTAKQSEYDYCGTTGNSMREMREDESSEFEDEDASSDSDGLQVYDLRPELRGRVLIIDNLPSDKKSNADVMKDMWIDLGYLPQCFKDLTSEKLLSEVKKFSKNPYLKNDTDSIVVMVMGYGSESEVNGTDGNPLSFNELIKNFDVAKCKSMARKPKLIFFEYCLEEEFDDFPPEPGRKILPGHRGDTLVVVKRSQNPDIKNGSSFIKAINREFRKGADTLEIHDLIREVGKDLKGLTVQTDTLNRLFYLHPEKI